MALQKLQHPLAEHYLVRLRDRTTQPEEFRRVAKALAMMLILEATCAMGSSEVEVESPIKATRGLVLSEGLAVVPVLRAGLGMVDPALELFPDVAVGYVGLERHEETAIARSYYSKLPDLRGKYVLCLDPMLATGGSASQAVNLMKAKGASRIVMVCIVAAPEGVARLERDHPDLTIVTAAVDEGLDARAFIVPGVGDFGDRLYGTL
jgi:uracil phosphoribosyltransferase